MSTEIEVELAVVQEKLRNLDTDLRLVFPEIEKNAENLNTIRDKLLAKIEPLEKENSIYKKQIDDLIDYKKSSDNRIKELENTKSYYKGYIAGILLIGTLFGVVLLSLIQRFWGKS